MLTSSRLVVLIAVYFVPIPGYAQTVSNPRGAFADLHVGPDWDDAANARTLAPGVTWGSGFAFGFDSGGSGVEFDVRVPQWHSKNEGPQRYQYAGPSFGAQQQGHLYEWSSTVRRRAVDVTVTHRASVPLNRRATFSWLVGGGFVYRPEETTSVTKEVLPDGQLKDVNTYNTTSIRNYLAATAGLDVELRLASHLSVVPRLRVMAFPSVLDDSGLAPRVLTARPEIAARWRF